MIVVLNTPHAKCVPRAVFFLADNQDTLADKTIAHATRAARRRTAFRAGAQRAAEGAMLEAHATLPGSSTNFGRQGAQPLSGAAGEAHELPSRYAQPMSFPEAQPTSDPSGTQQAAYG
jgi:hypothetical protein